MSLTSYHQYSLLFYNSILKEHVYRQIDLGQSLMASPEYLTLADWGWMKEGIV